MNQSRNTSKIIYKLRKMFSSGASESNHQLVKSLNRYNIIKSDRISDVMAKIDRGHFVKETPYADKPVYIGFGATISAPHMHAAALEIMDEYIEEGNKVLDIGSGTGYLVACLSLLVGNEGKVYGVEHVEELQLQSIASIHKSLKNYHPENFGDHNWMIVHKDGRKGLMNFQPFDCIHVGAVIKEKETLYALASQLKIQNGILIAPVESHLGLFQNEETNVSISLSSLLRETTISDDSKDQLFIKITRNQDSLDIENLLSVRYVPLTDYQSQINSA
eukprot:maker-scaffold_1-snap-gene-29.51-mRNA-1 protein AED:0.02 eAED:0.02 QI:88/1/1/1/0.33/0.25/4/227/275